MWLGKQQKKTRQAGESQVGKVTIGGEKAAVLLDSERRGLEVYSPGGYHWTPRADQKVLVLQGQGEIPCVVGLRQGERAPEQVTVEADGGGKLLLDGENGTLTGKKIILDGAVYVKGEKLETVIEQIVIAVLASLG
jgi:hypothetical protein